MWAQRPALVLVLGLGLAPELVVKLPTRAHPSAGPSGPRSALPHLKARHWPRASRLEQRVAASGSAERSKPLQEAFAVAGCWRFAGDAAAEFSEFS